MTRQRIAVLVSMATLAWLAAGREAAFASPQDAGKQESQPEPVPKEGFGRKADRTVLECVDFFWHEVTYAVYVHDHLPNSPPVNIRIGDKNTRKPCRAPAPEHLREKGTDLADAPMSGLLRRDDIVVSMCIKETWHDLTYALFERRDDKDEPDASVPPIRVLISDTDTGMVCTPIPEPKAQPPAAADAPAGQSRLGTSHARSECGDDGVWHVISDEDWIRPDGTHFKRRSDTRTTYACKPGDEIPQALPGSKPPVEKGERTEDAEVRECINGRYWYRKYAQYKRADGTTWVDSGPGKWLSETTKNEPCSEKIGMLPARARGACIGGELAKNTAAVRSTERLAEGGALTNQFDDSGDPLGLGVVAGENFAIGKLVVGPFGSFDWLSQTVNHTFSATSFLGTTTHWILSGGARVGVVTTNGILIYGAGGLSWLKEDLTVDFGNGRTTASRTTSGFTLGGGAEFRPVALQRGRLPLAVFVQYRYTIWADATLNAPSASPNFDYAFRRRDGTIRFGVLFSLRGR